MAQQGGGHDDRSRDQKSGGPSGPGKPTGTQPSRGLFGLVSLLLIAVLLFMFLNSPGGGQQITLAQFETHWADGQIVEDSVVIRSNAVTARQKPGPDSRSETALSVPFNAATGETVTKRVLEITDNRARIQQPSAFMPFLLTFGPLVLILLLIWFFVIRGLRNAGAGPGGMLGSFGKSRHRVMNKEMTGVTFADVAGIDEAKEEVAEIIEFLRNPRKFTKLGGRIPRGVLLIGEPGCGKTLLAKAIAGEADVPFFSISGSDFVEMFVGVGASRVRDLFRQAKENSPCIVFLDEIDAVGRRRGMGYNGGGHDEREQTLNAILVEMDGFDTNDQVIVIAATNRADVLDPALIRPGRFDRQVYVPLPDVKGRLEILKVHAKKVKIHPPLEHKLTRIARGTPMFSGADLAAIINEAALLATLAGKDAVELEDLEEARDKVRWGRAKRSRSVDERDRLMTAYHEAGHAVVQTVLKEADPVHKVSIIPRGPYGGATFSLPEKDRQTYNRSYVEATLRVLCAGRLAEELVGQDMNSGAAADIRQATQMARMMVTEWGMSERLGFVYYGEDGLQRRGPLELGLGREFSDKTVELIDEEVKRTIDAAYADTRRLIHENRDRLEAVAQALLKYETLSGEEVRQIMAGEPVDKPTVADLIAAEQGRRPDTPVARPVHKPPDEQAGPLPSPA